LSQSPQASRTKSRSHAWLAQQCETSSNHACIMRGRSKLLPPPAGKLLSPPEALLASYVWRRNPNSAPPTYATVATGAVLNAGAIASLLATPHRPLCPAPSVGGACTS